MPQSDRPPPPVSKVATAAYRDHADALARRVDANLLARDDLDRLIGANPLQVMRDNHDNHVRFITNVLALSSYQLLEQTLPWIYRTYRHHGFSYAYFPAELRAFCDAVRDELSAEHAAEIIAVYEWMLARHESTIAAAEAPTPRTDTAADPQRRDALVALLLSGRRGDVLDYAQEAVDTPADLERFYLQELMPAMYAIGDRWERGELSVAHEHLASALAGQIMATLYPVALSGAPSKGVAVVTAAPYELHEMGARMVADLLECDGWQVRYVGANTPAQELLAVLRDVRPFLLCVSVGMPFNLISAAEMIAAARQEQTLAPMRVLVGGKTLNDLESARDLVGADGFAKDAAEAVRVAAAWWLESRP